MTGKWNRDWTTASVGALMLSLALVPGCGYGKVSPAAYDHATALYSIANRRADDKLEEFSEHIAAARTQGAVSEQEAAWLESIVDDARQGQWEAAAKASREMMEDQVGRDGRK
jgi:hypothetical protein